MRVPLFLSYEVRLFFVPVFRSTIKVFLRYMFGSRDFFSAASRIHSILKNSFADRQREQVVLKIDDKVDKEPGNIACVGESDVDTFAKRWAFVERIYELVISLGWNCLKESAVIDSLYSLF